MRRGGTVKIRGTQIMAANRGERFKKISVGARSRMTGISGTGDGSEPSVAVRRTGDGSGQPAGARRNQVSRKGYGTKSIPYIVRSDEYYDYMSNGTKKPKDVPIDKFYFRSSKYNQLKKNVAVNIKRIRNEKGLNCEEVAQKAGVTRQYVGQIEKEKKNITMEKLCAIAEALHVDVAFLLSKTPLTKSEQYIKLLVDKIHTLSSRRQIELCIEMINKLSTQEES